MKNYIFHLKKLVYLIAILSFGSSQNIMYLSDTKVESSDNSANMDIAADLKEDIRGFQLEISFNPNLASIDTVIAKENLDGFTLSYNEPAAGTLKIIAINFSGKTIQKGVIKLAAIKFNVKVDQLTVSRVSIVKSVVSLDSGTSLAAESFPGYLLHPDQNYVTVNRIGAKWNMNLVSIEDLSALQFSFDYNTRIASIDSIIPDDKRLDGLTLSASQPQSGNLKMVVNSFTNTPVSKGNGPILEIHKKDLIPIDFYDFGKSGYGSRKGARLVEHKEDLYLLGGDNGHLVKYNPALNSWASVMSNLPVRIWPTAQVVGDKIYAIGGRNTTDGKIVKNQVYDIINDELKDFADMLYPVKYMGSVVYNNQIYVLGGHSEDNQFLDKVQKYDPVQDTWTLLSSMPTAKTTDAVVHNGKIYVVGGYSNDGTGGKDHKFIDVYDIGSDTWLNSIEMPVYLSANSLSLYKDFIFMVSDYDDHIGKVFAYNVVTDTWLDYSTNNFKRRRHMASIIKNDRLYTYGGSFARILVDPQDDSTVYEYDDLQVATIIPTEKNFPSISDFSFSESFGVKSDGTLRSIAALNSYYVDSNSSPEISTIADTSVNEDTPLVIEIKVTDRENDLITLTASSTGDNLTMDITETRLTITPKKDWYGSQVVRVYANDGNSTALSSFIATYLPVNDAPYISTTPNNNIVIGNSYEYEFLLEDVDNDNNLLEYAVIMFPSWLSHSNQTLSGKPDSSHIGKDSVSISVSDGLLTAYQNYSIQVLSPKYENTPPKITSVPITSISEENEYGYVVVADDADGDRLNYKVMIKPDWITVLNDTILKGTPDDTDVGKHNVSITVNDGYFNVKQNFQIEVKNVNDPPVFTSLPIVNAPEDTLYTYKLGGFDPDGDSLVYTLPGLVDWLSFDGVNTISGTPDDEDIGTHAVIAVMSDGFVNVNQAFFITVTNTNDPPVFTTTPSTKVIATEPYLYIANFSDPDVNTTLTTNDLDIVTLPSWLNGQKGNADGVLEIRLTGTPTDSDVGTIFPVALSVNDGADTTIQNFSIEVVSSSYQNSAPSFVSEPSSLAYEDSLYTYKIHVKDTNPNDSLKLSIKESPSWLSFDGDTTLLGTPNQSHVGNALVHIEVTDGFEVIFQKYTISVSASNDPPIFTSIPTTVVYEDSLYSYEMVAQDADNDNSSLIFAGRKLPSFITYDGKNKLSGRPKNDDVGEHEVIISVTDGVNIIDQSFVVNVKNTNDSPVLSDIEDVTIPEDSSIVMTLSANDMDGDTLTFGASSNIPQINFAFDEEKMILSPFEDWFGTATIKISVNDGFLATFTEFKLNVLGSQDAPKPFEWINPPKDSIFIDQSNSQAVYTLKWEHSKEVDFEDVSYEVYAQIGLYEMELIHDTTGNQFDISYEEIMLNVFENIPISRATITFDVRASDGIDTTKISGDNRKLFIDRKEYLTINEDVMPSEFALHNNYPNPFNPTTQIRFDLPQMGDAKLLIYNMLGQKIRVYRMNDIPAGYHSITWDATNDYGDPISAGVYLYQLQAEGYVKTKKMVLLK